METKKFPNDSFDDFIRVNQKKMAKKKAAKKPAKKAVKKVAKKTAKKRK